MSEEHSIFINNKTIAWFLICGLALMISMGALGFNGTDTGMWVIVAAIIYFFPVIIGSLVTYFGFKKYGIKVGIISWSCFIFIPLGAILGLYVISYPSMSAFVNLGYYMLSTTPIIILALFLGGEGVIIMRDMHKRALLPPSPPRPPPPQEE
jgi:peptidoglycan/LPS O-acetylase OafA/YrhL